MRILVTGSDGVIGQSMVPRLSGEVRCFDVKRDASQDVLDYDSINSAVMGFRPDVVIHMAAQVGRFNGEEFPDLSVRSNMLGTLNVVRACQTRGCFLVNFSTSEVYGHDSVLGKPDILAQNGMYGLTKLAAEGIVKHCVDTYDLRAVSIRPFMVYGPHEVPKGKYRSAVSNFLSTAHSGGMITAHKGCVRSWCYVDDFVDGINLVLANLDSFIGYEAFSIGTEEYRSMEECAQAVIRTVGKGSYKVTEPPDSLVSIVKEADFSRIREMGFSPKVGMEEGIARTYAWMRENHVL